jgi:peroxiredoxin
MTMRGRLLTAAALAVLVLPLAGCSDSATVSPSAAFPVGDGTVTMVQPVERGAPIDLSGTTLSGKPLALESLRGKPVVLNVWGSWCPPCRKEAPALAAAAPQLKAQGVEMVGINVKDQVTSAARFEEEYEISYPSLHDTGTLLLALRGAVPPNSIPSTVVLDAQGRVAARFNGPITEIVLRNLVQDVQDGGSRVRPAA